MGTGFSAMLAGLSSGYGQAALTDLQRKQQEAFLLKKARAEGLLQAYQNAVQAGNAQSAGYFLDAFESEMAGDQAQGRGKKAKGQPQEGQGMLRHIMGAVSMVGKTLTGAQGGRQDTPIGPPPRGNLAQMGAGTVVTPEEQTRRDVARERAIGQVGEEQAETSSRAQAQISREEQGKDIIARWEQAQTLGLSEEDAQRYALTGTLLTPAGTRLVYGTYKGQKMSALFDPKLRRYTNSQTGEDITAGFVADPPVSMQPVTSTGTRTMTDPLTGVTTTSQETRTSQRGGIPQPPKLPGSQVSVTPAVKNRWNLLKQNKVKLGTTKLDQAALAYGQSIGEGDKLPAQISGTEQTIVDQADAIKTMGQGLIDQLPSVAAEIGPFAGRVSEIEARLGTVSPQFRHFYALLKSFYAAQGKLHGWRAIRVTEEFQKALNVVASGAEGGAAAIRGSMEAADAFARAYRREPTGREIPTPPGARPANVPAGYIHVRTKDGQTGWVKPEESQGLEAIP